MTVDTKDFRLDGIYVQRQDGYFMQRIKLPAGVISATQARIAARAAERFGRGALHLTTRGSIEIHWLTEPDLFPLKRMLASAGMTSRGACGGAVRGVTCGSSQNSERFPAIEFMVRRLQRHFTGNPRFERLPKKFKIGMEAGEQGGRHLIQDVGLVMTAGENGTASYNVWVAGGLGREPQAGFLLERTVPEERIIPLIEAILRVYAAGTPAGKRLKHLLRDIGEEEFRRRLAADSGSSEELPPHKGFPETILPERQNGELVTAYFFAGSMSSSDLLKLADFADDWSGGVLLVSSDQNIAFPLVHGACFKDAQFELAEHGFQPYQEQQVSCRICPGSHECRAGLVATRDIAREIITVMGDDARTLSWAFSGCPNSCTQPQLADYGIVTSRLHRNDDGSRTPLFDLYRTVPGALGEKIAAGLDLKALTQLICGLG